MGKTENMKKTYHICLSSGNEIYCRDNEDYTHCFNALALAIAETESSLLADSIMSNHIHECVRTESPQEIIKRQRYKYARYFNAKYSRRGRLGERTAFTTEINGLYHTIAALSYVFRNALHHGITATPLAYPHSSARVIFKSDIGSDNLPAILPEHKQRAHLPSRNQAPKGYRMDKNGLLLREDVIDIADVQHLFGTPRAYLYYMNRLSGEEWQREQEKDSTNTNPITISTIEKGITDQKLEQMLRNEHGRNDYKKMSDINLCELVDKQILPDLGKKSVYLLTSTEKQKLARYLYQHYRLPETQIKRCLAIF